MIAAEPAPRFRVNGTLGSYVKFGLDPQEAALLGGARPEDAGLADGHGCPRRSRPGARVTLATQTTDPVKLERSKVPSEVGDYRNFYANVRDAIRGEAPLVVSPEDGYRTIRLLELALLASDQNHTLPVEFEA